MSICRRRLWCGQRGIRWNPQLRIPILQFHKRDTQVSAELGKILSGSEDVGATRVLDREAKRKPPAVIQVMVPQLLQKGMERSAMWDGDVGQILKKLDGMIHVVNVRFLS